MALKICSVIFRNFVQHPAYCRKHFIRLFGHNANSANVAFMGDERRYYFDDNLLAGDAEQFFLIDQIQDFILISETLLDLIVSYAFFILLRATVKQE